MTETQMVWMVFFLILALIYLLLLLYGGIWKQNRGQMIRNAMAFTAAFLIAACLSMRDGFKIPYAACLLVGALEIGYAIVQIRDARIQGKHHLQGNAIQESLDNLPSGVGFFDAQGMPVLINRQMHCVCRVLTGRDVQSAEELRTALKHPCKDGVVYDPDFQVYCFRNGGVWKFSEDFTEAENGERFLQFLASEVSELYQGKQLLEKENQRLQEMSEAMKELSENIVRLTREEETLAMKMRVHDDLGYSVLSAHRMLTQNSEETRETFLAQWNWILRLLRKDNEPDARALHQMVQERAEALGVHVFHTGETPDDSETAELLDVILLEAISNSVRHAGATELFMAISSRIQAWEIVITNNGRKPDKEVEEGGGLSAIRKKVERDKGTFRIRSFPEYALIITIPKKEAMG